MFGKYFSSTFTGSMIGSGLAVFAVWGYVIANTRWDGTVELHPIILAAILGCTVEEVEEAISKLGMPDQKSRNNKEEGRRLIQRSAFLYFVPTYVDYRAIRDDTDRREYMRNYMNKYRKKHVNAPVNTSKPQLAHTDTDTDIKNNAPPQPPSGAFSRFWEAWPKSIRKGSKGKCLQVWKRGGFDSVAQQIVANVETLKRSSDWCKDGGAFIPAPLVYLNQRRWDGAEAPVKAEPQVAMP